MNFRRIAIILMALVAASCTTQIILEPADPSVKVVMNALLKTSQTEHLILLSASSVSDTQDLQDATVTVSINGGAPVVATYQPYNPDDEYLFKRSRASYYLYRGTFNPGDKVRVEAKTKYGNVHADVVVPDKVNMADVDTLRTTIRGSGYTEVNMQFKILISDKAATDDFYRLTFYKNECYEPEAGQGKENMTSYLYADGSSDPVLSEGTLNTGDLLSELLEIDNTYLIFNDNTFPGASRTLRVNVNMENLIAGFSFNNPLPEYESGYTIVAMEHLSFEHYYYLKALTNLSNLGYNASFFFEPTTIPSNVEGGLGFVAVSACSDAVWFKIPDDIYLYEVRYREEHPEMYY